MRRITIFAIEGEWTFAPGARSRQTWPNILQAATAAAAFGDTLRGSAAGYVLRLSIPGELSVSRDGLTMCTRIFG